MLKSFCWITTACVLFLICFQTIFSDQAAAEATIETRAVIGGATRGCLLEGSRLYSLTGRRLAVIDISSQTNPVELGSLALPGVGRRLAISDQVLYVACWKGGLVAVDVSAPATPMILSQLTFDSDAEQKICETFDVEISGSYAYVADQTSGFITVDISDPAQLAVVSAFAEFENPRHRSYDIYIDGAYAYVACELDGLYVFDISTPASPQLYSIFKDEANQLTQFYQTVRDGNYLYIASGVGLVILDVSDLKNPVYTARLNNEYQGVLGLVKIGNYAYLCTEFSDFFQVDVSDPQNPEEISSYEVHPYHSLGIVKSGTTIALANHNFGLRLFDVSAGTIAQISTIASVGQVMDCQGAGNYAYAAALTNGLQVLDVSNPQRPAVAATLALGGNANGLIIDNSTVYVAEIDADESEGGYFESIDITNPAQPQVIGSVELPGRPFDLVVDNGIAYVALQTAGIALVDVVDPSDPVLLSTFDTGGSCYKTAVSGNYLFAADGTNGFAILDIADPEYPKKIIDGFDNGTVQDVVLWENHLFVPGGTGGLSVFDISSLAAPVFTAAIDPDTVRHAGGSIKAATAFGSYLLTAESNGGVRLFDLGDPGRPAETAVTRDLFGDPVKITYSVDQQLAYGSAQIAGLQIYAVTTPAAVPQSFEGRWVGSGDDAVTAVGVTIEIDQAQADISGSVTLAGRRIARGSLAAAVDNSTLSGTITFADSGSAAIQLAYDSLTDTLSGTISGSSTVESITLDRAGIRSQLPLYDILAIMQEYLADRITSSPYPLELLMLNKAAVAFGKALNSTTLSDMLLNASVAEAFITLGSPGGVVAAADSWLQPSGRWEIDNARSIADGMLKDICLDYREEISGLAKKGNQLYSLGVKLALKGNPALAIYAYAGAAGCFEQIFALYQDNQPLCPEYDLADFNGYYEGIIDFGFSMGAVGMCVTQADNGSISGQAIIEIAATGEKMGGNILEASNESVNDASIINGYIQIFVGSTEAHVLMIDWQHNPSIDQWEGGVDVDLQHVDATSTVKFVAAECPDEWLIEAAEIID